MTKDKEGMWDGWLQQLNDMMRSDVVSYAKFSEVVLSCVVGKTSWKMNSGTRKLSEFVTVSDEAFGLLLMFNSWEVWKMMSENAKEGKPIGKAKRESNSQQGQGGLLLTKYTSNGAYVKKNKGWSDAGLDCFLNLVQKVRDDREQDSGKANGGSFEDSFKTKMAEKLKKRLQQQPFQDDENGGTVPRYGTRMYFDE